MKFIAKNIRQIYIESFSMLYAVCPKEVLGTIRNIVDPAAEKLAETFYAVMLQHADAGHFLNHDLVHTRLAGSMARWLRELFAWREGDEIPRFVDMQFHVGEVHARIDLPPHVLNQGFRVLKNAISETLGNTLAETPELLSQALTKMHQMLDITSAAMNESYFSDLMSNERQAQALQAQIIGQDLVVRMERLRADMFDWQRRIVTLLHREILPDISQLPSASNSDFGLWITHKANLFFSPSPEVEKIEIYLKQLDDIPRRAHQMRQQGTLTTSLDAVVEELDSLVTRISWLLSSLVERHTESEAGKDTLTRLFNRRFLDTILQRETRHSIRSGSRYALLLVDIDHFKRVNDTYGHDAGDRVLQQCAELLQSNIRAGDFLFRYGGEEFLIVVTDVTTDQAQQMANKLVMGCREKPFTLGDPTPIQVTMSIGIAVHDGHPDYTLLIAQADRALYAAKNSGRDRIMMANQG